MLYPFTFPLPGIVCLYHMLSTSVYPLYNNPIAMIYFMLNDLCCPAGVFVFLFSETHVLILHFNFPISDTGSCSFQGEASFFCFILILFVYNSWIKHKEYSVSGVYCYDIFLYSYHICCHSDTLFTMCFQCIQQVYCCLPVRTFRWLRFLC